MKKCRLKSLGLLEEELAQYLIRPVYDSDNIHYRIHKLGMSANEVLPSSHCSLREEFSKRNKDLHCEKMLEIACGTGDFITACAAEQRNVSFIGVDHALPVIERAIRKTKQRGLENLLFYSGRIEDFLAHDFKDETFAKIFVNFPDPWPKKRHRKRRILQPEMAVLLSRALQSGRGELITATDLEYLYSYHLEILDACTSFRNLNWPKHRAPLPVYDEADSVYQRKGLEENRKIYYTVHRAEALGGREA